MLTLTSYFPVLSFFSKKTEQIFSYPHILTSSVTNRFSSSELIEASVPFSMSHKRFASYHVSNFAIKRKHQAPSSFSNFFHKTGHSRYFSMQNTYERMKPYDLSILNSRKAIVQFGQFN